MQICTKCGIEKDSAAFYASPHSWCRACRREDDTNRRKSDPERNRAMWKKRDAKIRAHCISDPDYREKQRAKRRLWTKHWNSANPGRKYLRDRNWLRANPNRDHMYNLRDICRSRGISTGKYNELLAAQMGLCAICHRPETRLHKGKIRRLALDHDHSFAKGDPRAIRGLLCLRCNLVLGQCQDDCDLLLACVAYLHTHRSRCVAK